MEERTASGLPAIWVPIAGLIWVGCGALFFSNSAHFGPGFLPALIWIFTLPVVVLFFAIAAIAKVYGYKDGDFGSRFKWWRLGIWIFTGVVYIAVVVAYVLMAMT